MGLLGSRTLKTMIAWQVIISVGTMLAAIGLNTPAGISAALFYLINTTWVVGGLFLLVDLVSNQRGSAGDKIVTAPKMRNRSLLGALFLLGAIAAIGLPPLSGFFAKLLILQAASPGVEMALLWSVILIGSFFTLIAYSHAGSIVFWRNSEGHIELDRKMTLPVTASVTALLALSVVIVALAGPISRYTDDTAAQLTNSAGYTKILEMPVLSEGKK
jgi:multicomponent K+:H+ antiporter subunit D